MRRKFALVFIVTLLLASHGWLVRGAQDSSVSATQLERLAALGKLWGTVKFFHPYLAYKDIDWDAALIKAIPLVKAARTPDEYRQAVNTMLQALGDPATTVENPTTQPKRAVPNKAATELSYYRVQDAYVIATVTDWVAAMLTGQGKAAFDKAAALHAEAAKAKGLVLDCRFGGFAYADTPVTYLEFQLENNLLPGLLQGAAPLGTQRYRQHIGYTPQGVFGGDYSSSLVTTAPPAFFGRAREAKPLVVLFDDRTPDIVAHLGGLQAAGAKLVQVGPANVGAGAQLLVILEVLLGRLLRGDDHRHVAVLDGLFDLVADRPAEPLGVDAQHDQHRVQLRPHEQIVAVGDHLDAEVIVGQDGGQPLAEHRIVVDKDQQSLDFSLVPVRAHAHRSTPVRLGIERLRSQHHYHRRPPPF